MPQGSVLGPVRYTSSSPQMQQQNTGQKLESSSGIKLKHTVDHNKSNKDMGQHSYQMDESFTRYLFQPAYETS